MSNGSIITPACSSCISSSGAWLQSASALPISAWLVVILPRQQIYKAGYESVPLSRPAAVLPAICSRRFENAGLCCPSGALVEAGAICIWKQLVFAEGHHQPAEKPRSCTQAGQAPELEACLGRIMGSECVNPLTNLSELRFLLSRHYWKHTKCHTFLSKQ